MKKFFSIFSGVLFFIFFAESVYAQRLSLSISPPLVELIIKPSKSVLVAFTITNNSDPVLLKINLKSFKPLSDTGTILVKEGLEGPINFNLENSVIDFSKPFMLDKNRKEQALLKISVPPNAPEGDYYYTLLVESIPEQGLNSTSVVNKASIGANIIITVTDDGSIEIKPKIAFFGVLPEYKVNLFGRNIYIFDSFSEIPVILKVANTGKNFFQPNGLITVEGLFGLTSSYSLLPQNVLAYSDRIIYASDSAGVIKKDYKDKTVSYVLSDLIFGRYKLRAELSFGQNNDSKLFADSEFYVFPIKIALAVAIVFFVFFILKAFFINKKSKDA
ncbi:MAG: hypothetical protein KatS3mg091_293 [Patescibacteria group bacterium]|nr:MAG: hypothetical protein KatS3mg090_0644 [Patescibacteria group bacterium]GIW63491.1 MAG: hypothetical protein KatS3mg091_293 [Patescibacteria group bacterium]